MENYQNTSDHLPQSVKIQNNMPLNASGSSLSANAPEFIPGGGPQHVLIQQGNFIQDPQHPEFIPGQRFNQPPQYQFTPYTPQQPNPDIQSYAQMNDRLAQISINSRLNQYHQPINVPHVVPVPNGPVRGGGVVGGRGRGYPSPNQNDHMKRNFEEAHIPSESEDIALNFLSEVIIKLEDNPGMFETYQKKMKEMFYELANNNFVMSNALELLFKQSIKSQNFRYCGARICNLLDDLEPSPDSLFRNLLKMKMDFERQELVKHMQQNEQYTVRGTTLFLAELYMQLRRSNETNRNVEIANSIICSVELLLSRIGPENLKCVCQTLKLCGFELDVDCLDETEKIIKVLGPHKTKFDTSTGRLIQSVLDLRGKRWGRNESFTQPSADLASQVVFSDGPVFYGPDGQVLTEEENSFLSSNVPSYANINFDDLVDDDSDELVDDEDNAIDLEIQLAFKEFVNSNKNINNSNAGGDNK